MTGVVFHDLADHTHGEGAVGAGSDLKPQFRFFGKVDPAGIDDDEFCSILHLFKEKAANFTLFVGRGDIASPEDGQFAWVVEIRHRIKSAGMDARNLPWGMTDILRSNYVW